MCKNIGKKDFEDFSEQQLPLFLQGQQVFVDKIPETNDKRTADYSINTIPNFHIENTTFEGYFPKVLNDFFESNKNSFGLCIQVKVELKEEKILIEEVARFECDSNVFMLVIELSPESLRPKIEDKIKRKYGQVSSALEGGILSIDFRVSGIDLGSLAKVLQNTLQRKGTQYPKLAGLLLVSQKDMSDILAIPDGVIIPNPFYDCVFPETLKSLLPPKQIEYELTPYRIEMNFKISKGRNTFNIALPTNTISHISGFTRQKNSATKFYLSTD